MSIKGMGIISTNSLPPLFSVFGRPLLLRGSSSLGGSSEHEDLEPLRVVAINDSEWGLGMFRCDD